jgi:uncharacterized protein YbjT (DUF2867 family)
MDGRLVDVRVVIAGGHGKIAMRLARMLAARGDAAIGLVRNPAHVAEVRSTGAEAVVCDLEHSTAAAVAAHLAGADAVVFAAGAGPGSGIPRKDSVDRAAAALLAGAAQAAGVRRHVQVSSMGVERAGVAGPEDVFGAYLVAKKAAEDDLRTRPLDWTILRPGRLTDEPGEGTVRLARHVDPGEVSRDDVAAVLVGLLDTPATAGLVLELVGGDTPIPAAIAALVRT